MQRADVLAQEPKRVANKKNNTQPASMISKTFLLVE